MERGSSVGHRAAYWARVGQMWTLFLLVVHLGIAQLLESPGVVQAGRRPLLRVMDHEDGEEDANLSPFRRQLIFPGTKWCGDGNVSKHDEDYGYFEKTDKCCKNHDYCPDYIIGGDTKYGLHNNAIYTRSHCDCDLEFYGCLKKTNHFTSDDIGFTYFNAIGTKCYREDYPIIRCFKYSRIKINRCTVYEVDQTKPLIWQWFDLPIY